MLVKTKKIKLILIGMKITVTAMIIKVKIQFKSENVSVTLFSHTFLNLYSKGNKAAYFQTSIYTGVLQYSKIIVVHMFTKN